MKEPKVIEMFADNGEHSHWQLVDENGEILWSEEPTEVKNNAVLPLVSKSLAPHRCPVCNGNGLVPNGFYMQTSGHWSTSSITPETCRSCGGTGVVWG